MLKNYLKIAFRSITKNKLFSLIKVSSLAIGLSASFVIGLMVYYDLSFDKFHPDVERVYRITSEFTSPEGNGYNPGVSYPLAEALKEKGAGLETVAPVLTTYPVTIRNSEDNKIFKRPEYVVYTDAAYFNVFEYDWIVGSPDNVLENPNEVVLSQNRANIYFPDRRPDEIMGSTLVYQDSIPVKITGIVANFENRTDLVFEEFISLKTAEQADMSNNVEYAGWNNTNSSSQLFVKLEQNVSKETVQSTLDALTKEHNEEEEVARGRIRNFYMQPLAELHLDPNYYSFDFSRVKASKSVLISLGFIALFLLLLGCINFINLNTAQATQRAKEIGVRKTLGGSKRQLVFQFLAETLLLTIFASALSIVFSYWLLQAFSDFIPEGLDFGLFREPWVIVGILVLLALVTLLSGFYPALVLSSYRPVAVLKSQISQKSEKTTLRKYLTVFQFSVAQVFVIATFLVGKQIDYLMTKDMGFRTEAIASVRTPWHVPGPEKRTLLAERIEALPMVQKLSLSGNPPASNSSNSSYATYFQGDKEINIALKFLYGDRDYLALYDIDLLAGRQQLNDSIRELVINETYSKHLGFSAPEEAIGKVVKINDVPHPIVGVMEDFNQRSLKSSIKPMAFAGDWYRTRSRFNTVHFSFQTDDVSGWSEAIAQIESIWDDVYPDVEFELTFMDDTIKRFYESERRTSTLLKWAMGLSIAISCLGLFGLVVYTTERRTKEIGIRKVLGASLLQLNILLCTEFLVLVGIAFVIAAPVAWYGLHQWLEDFAYKTELSAWIFILSGIIMAFISLIIMSIRTIAKANTNPVKSLRTE